MRSRARRESCRCAGQHLPRTASALWCGRQRAALLVAHGLSSRIPTACPRLFAVHCANLADAPFPLPSAAAGAATGG